MSAHCNRIEWLIDRLFPGDGLPTVRQLGNLYVQLDAKFGDEADIMLALYSIVSLGLYLRTHADADPHDVVRTPRLLRNPHELLTPGEREEIHRLRTRVYDLPDPPYHRKPDALRAIEELEAADPGSTQDLPSPNQVADLYLSLQAEFGRSSLCRPTFHQVVRGAWRSRKHPEVTLGSLKVWIHAMNVNISEWEKGDEGGQK
jgi:hypothetical protein